MDDGLHRLLEMGQRYCTHLIGWTRNAVRVGLGNRSQMKMVPAEGQQAVGIVLKMSGGADSFRNQQKELKGGLRMFCKAW